jgi:hypothetical protein
MTFFAKALRSLPESQQTGRTLDMSLRKFERDWENSKSVKSEGEGIPLPPARDQGLHPRNCSIDKVILSFDFELGTPIDGGEWHCPKKAAFEVCVRGALETGECQIALEDHWRVDTDMYADQPEEGREPHPLIHFQRGGDALYEFAQAPGFVPGPALPAPVNDHLWHGVMQIPGPRIPLPPMCPILAIDYAISQLNGVVWKKLRAKRDYQVLVADAQSRLWVPYFHSLTNVATRRKYLGRIMVDQ